MYTVTVVGENSYTIEAISNGYTDTVLGSEISLATNQFEIGDAVCWTESNVTPCGYTVTSVTYNGGDYYYSVTTSFGGDWQNIIESYLYI